MAHRHAPCRDGARSPLGGAARALAALAFATLLAPAAKAAVVTPDVELVAETPGVEHFFGTSVAADGLTVVVGAPDDWRAELGSGHAEVFRRSGGTWIREAVLSAPDPTTSRAFGRAVAVDGDTALVARLGEMGASTSLGAVHVYVRQGGAWIEEAMLEAADLVPGDLFGVSVALEGDVAVVAAVGHPVPPESATIVYVFRRASGRWTQAARLVPAGVTDYQTWGTTLALGGDRLVIGAPGDDQGLPQASGSVRVYGRAPGGAWREEAMLVPPVATENGHFGRSVALEGDRILVGEWQADDQATNAGAAHVFALAGGTWTHEATLLPSDGASIEFFGTSVALDDGLAMVGAFQKRIPVAGYSGAVVLFELCSGAWSEADRLQVELPAANDRCGTSVAAGASGIVVAGVSYRDALGVFDAGSAAVFTVARPLAEVTPTSGAPLLVSCSGADWTLSLEDLGAAVLGYNTYEGSIGAWYSHAATGCSVPAMPAGAGRLAVTAPLPAADVYVLVTATTACGEGSTGAGSRGPHPTALLGCP